MVNDWFRKDEWKRISVTVSDYYNNTKFIPNSTDYRSKPKKAGLPVIIRKTLRVLNKEWKATAIIKFNKKGQSFKIMKLFNIGKAMDYTG